MLGKNGLFTNYLEGMTGHNRDEVYLWRLVIDQTLRDAISTNTSAATKAVRWIHSKPGDPLVRVTEDIEDPDTGQVRFETYEVDYYEEFLDVCEMAALDPDFVRSTWIKVYNRIMAEDKKAACPKKKH